MSCVSSGEGCWALILPPLQSIQKLLEQVDLAVHVLDMLVQSLKRVALDIDYSDTSEEDMREVPIKRQVEEQAPQQVQASVSQQEYQEEI